ncbi:NAD-dependent epimerase/dehydratase family protein [Oceanobacillus polygoni]|uniref:UDP-glucose 4-epimerase n=1 Tax=Oceanobacillus polygoni TaxID=1235259 RepID=A0A9X0YS00_9BACI|nr:NAD-dependent epimerase/dehydratase family protein [Oceanobacillus polygoni]MBP2075901.1 UDP-glucose 4-epimerase [Oceanobacillus polygoni]
MKRILITGKNSYVGNSFEKWLEKFPEKYMIEKISLRDESWRKQDLSIYDVILHVAGIAHITETKENENLYYTVNSDLAYEVAKKAKDDGTKHFIFLSSMSVYGIDTGVIDHDTIPKPNSNYGKSKFQAEVLIGSLGNDSFKIAILRPPMIYGKGCKGNYPRLAKLAAKTPMFPNIDNKRSMIYIDNLSEFIRNIIDNYEKGIFCPQNKEYVNTSNLVWEISQALGKNIRLTKFFNLLINNLNHTTINKVFGELIYEKKISNFEKDYNIIGFKESIHLTECGDKYNDRI